MNADLRTGVLHGKSPLPSRGSSLSAPALIRRRSDDGRARLQTELACDVGDRLSVTLEWHDGSESWVVTVYAVHVGFVDVRGWTAVSGDEPERVTVRSVESQ